MQRLAILAAQAYRKRWQIERSFKTVKHEFSLEKLRVRTFRRQRNVFSLCVFRPKARTACAESLDRFWTRPKIFFAQCFQGSREDSG